MSLARDWVSVILTAFLLMASLGLATFCLTTAINRRSGWRGSSALSAGLAVLLLGLGLLSR